LLKKPKYLALCAEIFHPNKKFLRQSATLPNAKRNCFCSIITAQRPSKSRER
jgi:hypothetical protein